MRDKVFWFKDTEVGISMAVLKCSVLSTIGAAQNMTGMVKKEALGKEEAVLGWWPMRSQSEALNLICPKANKEPRMVDIVSWYS